MPFVWKLDVHFFSPLLWKPGESNGKVRTDWTHYDYRECVFMLDRERKTRERVWVCVCARTHARVCVCLIWVRHGWSGGEDCISCLTVCLSLGLFWLTAPCCLSRMSKDLYTGEWRVFPVASIKHVLTVKLETLYTHNGQQGYWTVAMLQAYVCVCVYLG